MTCSECEQTRELLIEALALLVEAEDEDGLPYTRDEREFRARDGLQRLMGLAV